MRICMVSDNYYPYVGGVAEHIHHLAVELRRRGHIVKILTTNFGGRSFECLNSTPDEEHVKRVGRGIVFRSNKSFARATVGVRLTARARRFFNENRFDVIHIHGALSPTLPLVAIQASTALKVMTFHANHDQSLGYAFFKPLLRRYFYALHGLVAVSDAALRSCAKYFPGPYRIIPNGIDTDFFSPGAAPLPELDNGRPKILFMGRFEPRKGLKYLLMAMPDIVREVPDVQLVAVGTGIFGYAYKGYLDKSCEANVLWPGLIPGADRPRYVASCDVFCSPAIGHESFGIVLLEAMACARPVVASDIAGYRTVVADGVHGRLVPPRDVKAIAAAIVELLGNPARRRQLGEAGRQRALEFSWPRIAEQVERLYEELMSRYPVPRFGRWAG
ncbi:MAG: glycosyltransferase family 4 protein [candidate division WOR-3 bacterium]